MNAAAVLRTVSFCFTEVGTVVELLAADCCVFKRYSAAFYIDTAA